MNTNLQLLILLILIIHLTTTLILTLYIIKPRRKPTPCFDLQKFNGLPDPHITIKITNLGEKFLRIESLYLDISINGHPKEFNLTPIAPHQRVESYDNQKYTLGGTDLKQWFTTMQASKLAKTITITAELTDQIGTLHTKRLIAFQ